MDQNIVVNKTEEKVSVMWDGIQIYFRPGQKKLFSSGVATSIVNDAEGLEIEEENSEPHFVEGTDVEEKEPVKIVEPPKVVEPPKDVYTITTTKAGVKQYRENGKIISKAAYMAATGAK